MAVPWAAWRDDQRLRLARLIHTHIVNANQLCIYTLINPYKAYHIRDPYIHKYVYTNPSCTHKSINQYTHNMAYTGPIPTHIFI